MVGRTCAGSRRKKLTEATHAVLGVAEEAKAIDDDLRSQCQMLSIDPAPFVKRSAAIQVCDVWPEHHTAVQLFMRLRTQWELKIGFGAAVYTGLIYSSVQTLIDAWRIPKRQQKELWDQLQMMELVALPILNERIKTG